jgi:hypothetical protein
MFNAWWTGFKDWLYKSYVEHPLYTIAFGIGCFAIGNFIF